MACQFRDNKVEVLSCSNQIGEIAPYTEGWFMWAIDELNLQDNGKFISPEFNFCGVQYRILLQLEQEHFWLVLRREDFSNLQNICVDFQLIAANKNRQFGSFTVRNPKLDALCVQKKYVERFRRGPNPLKFFKHSAVIICLRKLVDVENSPWLRDILQKDKEDIEENTEYKSLKNLQKDFKNLLLNSEDSDVTLTVHGKEFAAHRAILRTRSPVFKAMFIHDLKETIGGVTIDDCDPKTFSDFLNYLYTGSSKNVSRENVCKLYTVSDKYKVEELKRECTKFVKSQLSVETFSDIFTMALKYSNDDFIQSATDFFCDNAKEIIHTEEWEIFKEKNSEEGDKLLTEAVLRRQKRA